MRRDDGYKRTSAMGTRGGVTPKKSGTDAVKRDRERIAGDKGITQRVALSSAWSQRIGDE